MMMFRAIFSGKKQPGLSEEDRTEKRKICLAFFHGFVELNFWPFFHDM